MLLNATLLPAERDLLLADAQPALVVADQASLLSLTRGDREAELAPWPLARPMHYTSGTSGRPKGVWSGVLSETQARDLFEEEADLWAFDPRDVHLVCSPLYHSAAVRFSAGTLLRGGTVVVLSKFDPAVAARAVADHRPTTAFMAPAHLQRLFYLEAMPAFDSFRLLAHAGAPCPEPLKRAAMARFPKGAVWEFYGSTEGQFTACSPDEWLARPGTVGRARPGRRLEVEPITEGDPMGRIWCHVPPYARWEYWRDEAKSAEAWRDSAFTVGDVGRMDPDGYLFLAGRRDDLIISGGVNVYPLEVEQALTGLAGVEELAVFGAPDPRWGHRVCAAFVGPADPARIMERATERLAPYKRPKDIYRVDQLPRTGTGKVRRTEVARALGLEPAADDPPPHRPAHGPPPPHRPAQGPPDGPPPEGMRAAAARER